MAWELRELAVGTIVAHLNGAVRWPEPAVLLVEQLLDDTGTGRHGEGAWHPYIAVWEDRGWHCEWRRGRYTLPETERRATWRRCISIPYMVDHLWRTGHFRDRDLVAEIEAELAGIAWIPLDDGTLLVVDDTDESDAA